MIGKTISHYKIIEKLGQGGMGVVYMAEDTDLKRTVALKFLTPQVLGDGREQSRFIREAQSAAALDHPSICTVHEISRVDEHTFIAMSYIEGQTLKEKIESGPLKLDEVIDIAIQVAEGLQEAHEKGVVHRDIKPANIMITPKGQAKIMDFGLAKTPGRTKLTKTGMTLGTAAYMSPEQACGGEIDPRTDIWSLGVVLYEMISGRAPFGADYEQALTYSILNESPEPLTGLRTGVPVELEQLVDRCMDKDAAKRYQTAGDLGADLSRIRDRLTTAGGRAAAVTAGRPLALEKPAAGRIAIYVVGVIILAVLALMVVKRPWSTRAPEESALAVVDFRSLESPDDVKVTAGMSGLLHVGLVESSPCRVVSPQYLQECHRRLFGTAKASIGEDEALAVAKESGATMLLSGQVAASGARPFVTWQLVDTRDGRSLGAQRVEGADLLQLADRIIAGVLPLVAEASGVDQAIEQTAIDELTTTSPEAYDHYIMGLLALEQGGATAAVPEFEMAVSIDTTFALGYLELSRLHYTAAYTPQRETAREYADKAWKYRDRLSLKDRMRLEARRHLIDSRKNDAIETYREMLARWPDDKTLLEHFIAVLYFDWNFREAAAIAEQALSVYPDDWTFTNYRANALSLFGRSREGLEVSLNYAVNHPDKVVAWMEAGQRCLEAALPDSAEIFLRRALEIEPAMFDAQRYIGCCDYYRGDIEGAIEKLNQILARDDLLDGQRRMLLGGGANTPTLARLYSESGRFEKVLNLIESARDYCSGLDDEIHLGGLRAHVLFELGRAEEVLDWSREALGWDVGESSIRRLHIHEADALADLDSLDAARDALARARAIEERLGLGTSSTLLTEAKIALAGGDPETALEHLLESERRYGHIKLGGYIHVDHLELTARAHRMAGRLEEAARVHEDLVSRYGGHALSHYELGRIYEEMGRAEDAERATAKFLEMWSKADEGLPQLEDARERLARLRTRL